jgi:hypothetical protein
MSCETILKKYIQNKDVFLKKKADFSTMKGLKDFPCGNFLNQFFTE